MLQATCPRCGQNVEIHQDDTLSLSHEVMCPHCDAHVPVRIIRLPCTVALHLSGEPDHDARTVLGAARTMPRAVLKRVVGLVRRRQARRISWSPTSRTTIPSA